MKASDTPTLFRRKIYQDLLDWKRNNGEYALLIEGARRVGKSTIVKAFADAEYESSLIIDFSNPLNDTVIAFEKYHADLDALFYHLQAIYGVKLAERKSLIVFDEVQFYPKARQLIKHLVQDGRYDYIETGSLISIRKNVENILIPSEELHIVMNPMDFEEFCWAGGDEITFSLIREHFKNHEPLGQIIHRNIMEKYKTYMIVGGMPQAVSKYYSTKDMSEVESVKQSIIKLYRNDMGKIPVGNGTKAQLIFENIPSLLSHHRKIFRPGTIKKSTSSRDYYDSVMWLKEAFICNICRRSTDPNIMLKLDLDDGSFKCYLMDTGLLMTLSAENNVLGNAEVATAFMKDKLSINEGMLFENSVAQNLVSSGHELFFYEFYTNGNNRVHEVDFLFTEGMKIIPIEVKSSSSSRHSSLDEFIKKYKRRVTKPIVIHPKDLREDGGVLYIPIYMAALL